MNGAIHARSFNTGSNELRNVMGSLRSAETRGGFSSQSSLPEWPFVTISRQGGSGAVRLGNLLVAHLSETPALHPWQCLDRELVERIAADHHLSTELIDSLEKSSHSWVSEFVESLRMADRGSPSELAVFRRAVETMRGLARAGHVILVGLGGALITRDMPLGIHVRIIAPLEWRVEEMARGEKIPEKEARRRVRMLDENRAAFLGKFWPHVKLGPELFHITLNAAVMSDEMMVQSIVPLVKAAEKTPLHRVAVP